MIKEVDEMSAASRGSQPFAWAADIPGKFGAAPTVLFGYTEKLVRSIAAAGGDLVQPFPLYRDPTLTDAEREAVERAVGFCECTTSPLPTSSQIATIRGLLGRTK
jgi:hypothetical protein